MKSINLVKGQKGQFFSVGVFLLIVVLLIIFTYSAVEKEKTNQFQIHRLRLEVINSFVEEFESTYSDQIIESSLKPSLAAYLNYQGSAISYDDFVNIMKTGKLGAHTFPELQGVDTNTTLRNILSTLTVGTDVGSDFNYTITKVEMTAPDSMKVTFNVDYKFMLGTDVWQKENVQIVKIINIRHLNHPELRVIIGDEDDWVPDTTTCFASQVFVDGTCGATPYNLKPVPVIPPAAG
jgi:hypothetical protein